MKTILSIPFLNVITTGDFIIFVSIILLGFFIASEKEEDK